MLVARLTLCVLALIATVAHAADKVAFAGFAYAGEARQIDSRFPLMRKVEAELASNGRSPSKVIAQSLAANPPANFAITTDGMASLKDSDQALATALVVTSESVSSERFGSIYKVVTNLRGQALVFDFKAMTVVRAYPLNISHLDVLDHMPGDAEKRERIKRLLAGGERPGLLDRYVRALSSAQLPSSGTRYLQIERVELTPGARAQLPEALRGDGVAEGWVADMFGEALLDRAQVPILPFTKGYAIGNAMSMRFSDGEVFNLQLPKPDYTIDLSVKDFKRVEYGSSAAGTSYIYASYSHVSMAEPMSGRRYLDADFKNGEVKAVPVTQSRTDDFPAFAESLRGLFTKLADVAGGKDSDWLAAAASGDNVKGQIESTRGVIKSCR
ncbi:hypothetical protein [Cupriavidus metallidurans]|uniref:hypothetical protein n=1 Tax=Cupriavidus metallidurans TaxID=119219 RepID=UPI00055C1E96|nr:hypothetical protein [Cupriavidus metallidurans]